MGKEFLIKTGCDLALSIQKSEPDGDPKLGSGDGVGNLYSDSEACQARLGFLFCRPR